MFMVSQVLRSLVLFSLCTFRVSSYSCSRYIRRLSYSTSVPTTAAGCILDRVKNGDSPSLRSFQPLSAKKGKGKAPNSKKGFQPKAVSSVKVESDMDDDAIAETVIAASPTAATSGRSEPLATSMKDLEDADIEDVMKKYGRDPAAAKNAMRQQQAKKAVANKTATGQQPAFGEAVLANIPMSLQKKIDNILITCTFIALTFVVLCGIGISFGAFRIVFKDVVVDPAVDKIIVDVLDPSFTPAIGVFFLFSITLGLFKFAQISSEQTVYRED